MLSFYFFFDEFYFQIVNVLFSFALCVVLDYAEYTYKWVLIWSIDTYVIVVFFLLISTDH